MENLNRILKAIKNEDILSLFIDKNESVYSTKVIPLEIVDDTIIGEIVDSKGNKTSEKILFTEDDIESYNYNPKEELEESISINSKVLNNMDLNKLGELSKKTNIEIKEEDEHIEDNSQQQQGILEFKTWCNQLGLELSTSSEAGSNIIVYKLIIEDSPVLVLIYEDGSIKIKGHSIKTFKDFDNLIKFFKQN